MCCRTQRVFAACVHMPLHPSAPPWEAVQQGVVLEGSGARHTAVAAVAAGGGSAQQACMQLQQVLGTADGQQGCSYKGSCGAAAVRRSQSGRSCAAGSADHREGRTAHWWVVVVAVAWVTSWRVTAVGIQRVT
jgi:hypothetical protein